MLNYMQHFVHLMQAYGKNLKMAMVNTSSYAIMRIYQSPLIF